MRHLKVGKIVPISIYFIGLKSKYTYVPGFSSDALHRNHVNLSNMYLPFLVFFCCIYLHLTLGLK